MFDSTLDPTIALMLCAGMLSEKKVCKERHLIAVFKPTQLLDMPFKKKGQCLQTSTSNLEVFASSSAGWLFVLAMCKVYLRDRST